jgi:hypothetical protein
MNKNIKNKIKINKKTTNPLLSNRNILNIPPPNKGIPKNVKGRWTSLKVSPNKDNISDFFFLQ